jgi:hypothetical protein
MMRVALHEGSERTRIPTEEKTMKLIRICMFALAVLLPTSWTLAHAGDDMKEGADKSAETKKGKAKKSKKKDSGDMGDAKKADMKGDVGKK